MEDLIDRLGMATPCGESVKCLKLAIGEEA